MSNNTNGANANVGGGQDGRESIHMADLATIRVNGLQALTPAVKAEIMQYWFEEQLGKMGYEYDVNWRRRFDAYFLPESAVAQLRLAETDANTDLTVWNASGDPNASTTNLEEVDLERGEGAGVGGNANRPLTVDEFIKQYQAEKAAEPGCGCNMGRAGWCFVGFVILLVLALGGVAIGVSQYYRLHPSQNCDPMGSAETTPVCL